MKIVFLSNYFNHHQKPLSDCLFDKLGDAYVFIETEEISEERIKLGWNMQSKPEYVKKSWLMDSNELNDLILNSDIVISGGAPRELVKQRIKERKIVLLYSERIFKQKASIFKYPVRVIKWHLNYRLSMPIYMLCASAYTASDYAPYFMYLKKTYKWGYFPETTHYDNIEDLINKKHKNSLLWVSRFIDLKHPEIALYIAERLKNEGYQFTMNMIGNGILYEKIEKLIIEKNLQDYVNLTGSMKPEQVRIYMEQSEIFLFTSDRNEGWGAVINESMNSGCAIVANEAIGSVPFLLEDGKNGYVYKDGCLEEVYQKTKYLLDNSIERVTLGVNAYNTIVNEWSAEIASARLLILCDDLIKKGTCSRFLKGPCSAT